MLCIGCYDLVKLTTSREHKNLGLVSIGLIGFHRVAPDALRMISEAESVVEALKAKNTVPNQLASGSDIRSLYIMCNVTQWCPAALSFKKGSKYETTSEDLNAWLGSDSRSYCSPK
jgi:hypothetical protein